ncbi:hypothetical protein K0M31_003399 [Melipona bicolor]|uniref:Uncharacterized protein n=1 Tax=Melipona bicolor TaxID=60889 RepID=A0AA40FZF6_9HYME|nr:hypothetical protein K0M31_003399 [Melipona bicolor]
MKYEIWNVRRGSSKMEHEVGDRMWDSRKCEMWNIEYGVWNMSREYRNVKCGTWDIMYGTWHINVWHEM